MIYVIVGIGVLILLIVLAARSTSGHDRWVCPSCKSIFQKTSIMMAMQRSDATVIGMASRNPRCPACGVELDGRRFMSGGYDLAEVKRQSGATTYSSNSPPAGGAGHIERGKQLFSAGQGEEAVQAFTRAIEENPANVDGYTFRGSALNALRRYAEAIADQTKAIELNPSALAYYYRGNTYHMAGQSRRALADVEQSLRLDATNPRAQENRHFLQLYLEQHPEAQ